MNKIKDLELKYVKENALNDKIQAYVIKDKHNCNYVTGYTGDMSAAIITEDKNYIVVNSLYKEQVTQETNGYIPIVFKKKPGQAIKELFQSKGIKHIAGEFKDTKSIQKLYDVKSVQANKDLIKNKRIVKNEYELDCIKKANKISCDAFNHCLQFIKPGVTELELAAEIEYYMKKNGSYKTAFETIVVSGVRSAMPHGTPSEKKLQPGDPITFDFGAVYRSYCADITRTVFLGKPEDEMKKVYETVLEAQKKAVGFVKSGITGAKADAYAREIITKKGYGKNFVHGLGHGVGLQVHEAPGLSKKGKTELEKNTVVTIEPGIYIEKYGGVRIEDSVIVKENSVEVMTQSADKELLIL